MSRLIVLTAAEQVASFLRGEVERGAFSGQMPGGDRLAVQLGVGRETADAALRLLEQEGLLASQGRRRGRLIVSPAGRTDSRRIRLAILPYVPVDRRLDYIVELEHALESAGHAVVRTPRSLTELDMDLDRIARMVSEITVDAWVVMSGSHEILEWFVARQKPTLALFGRRRSLRIASVGPDKPPVMAEVTRKLIHYGHQRIVLMARGVRRLPVPGTTEQAFLDTLAAHGIAPGPYNLPDWEESVEGYYERLESLFRITPPTALIIDEVPLFLAAQQFLAGKGLRVPRDVSLFCTDYDVSFEWCRPNISHISWQSRPVVKRIMRWANRVSSGKTDLQQSLTPATFVEGGTIGPVKER